MQQDPSLQESTASDPLTLQVSTDHIDEARDAQQQNYAEHMIILCMLQEEYEMQHSWQEDKDSKKLCFHSFICSMLVFSNED